MIVAANDDVAVGTDIWHNSPQCPNCADVWSNTNQITDPRTIALWYGASALVGYTDYDISLVQAGRLFGTLFAANTPLLNAADALRIGWSYKSRKSRIPEIPGTQERVSFRSALRSKPQHIGSARRGRVGCRCQDLTIWRGWATSKGLKSRDKIQKSRNPGTGTQGVILVERILRAKPLYVGDAQESASRCCRPASPHHPTGE